MSGPNVDIRDHFVPVPDGHLFTRCWIPADRTDRPPLILLHESLGSVDLWREFPEALARRLRRIVFAYDRLGFGRSTPRTAPPSFRFIEEEAEVYFPAVRRALGVEEFVLFGHSVGGGMALTIAATVGEACRAVVSESAQAFLEDRTIDGLQRAAQPNRRRALLERLRRWHGERAKWVLSAWLDVWLSPHFADWSLAPVLPRVTCPVLAIHGDRDEYGSTRFPEFIRDRAGGPAELAILPDCGHVPHRETPEAVLQLVADFVDRHDA